MGGKSMNRGLGLAIGLAAAIAIPFAAPALAGVMLGSTAVSAATFAATSAAIGAGLGVAAGALSGSLTGNAGRGALFGGLGGAAGGFLGGATQVGLFSGAPATAAPVAGEGTAAVTGATAAPTSGAEVTAATQGGVGGAGTAAPTVAPATGGATTGIGGASNLNVASAGYTGAESAGAAAGYGGATGPAVPQTWGERFMSTFSPTPAPGATQAPSIFTAEGLGAAASKGMSQLATPAGLAGVGQLAMTMFNKPPEGLSPQERDYLKETAEMASSNRALFEQRVDAARRMLNQGTPNPEMAYAQANMATQRQFREAGLRTPEDERRAAIAGARRGAAAVPAEMTRAAEATRVGLAMMPSATPRGYESYALEATRDAERRQREYQADLARSVGALGGALGGRRNEKLF